MKKRTFWIAMCIASLLNGAIFFWASLSVMQHGLDGIDNQASLLFIPFLWIIATLVLIVLNIYTLIRGAKITQNQMIDLFDVFRFSGLSAKAKALTQMCRENNIPYVDAYECLKNENGALPDDYCRDGYIHLNHQGAAVVVEALEAFAEGW